MNLPPFEAFASIPRLFRGCVVTEKIDGTNAQVYVSDDLETVAAASRSRWITPEDDNHGFAHWVAERRDELRTLGPGHHFGEWWGSGIQRRYGLKEKRFSLFNVARWGEAQPACCHVVPVLHRGPFHTETIRLAMDNLGQFGSAAAPGFMEPEGIVVWHEAGRALFKATLGGDGHKGSR